MLANVRLDLRAENTPHYDGSRYRASFDALAVRAARPGAGRFEGEAFGPDDDR